MFDSFTNIVSDVYRLVDNTSPNKLNEKLNKIALESKRKQSRICLHKDDNNPIQIMYICHLKDCYVRIHKHLDFPEWLIFLNAKANIFYFDENGDKFKTIFIDTIESEGPVFHFIPKNVFHTIIFELDSYFIEVKQGPFNKKASLYLED